MSSSAASRSRDAPAACAYPSCGRARFRARGVEHAFCGRTHAEAAAARARAPALPPPHGACHECRLDGCAETVAFDADTARVHDFCRKAHHAQAVRRGAWPASVPRAGPTARACCLPGCSVPVALDDDGAMFDFCGRTHARRALQRSLVGFTDPDVDRCYVGQSGWKLSLLKRSHPEYDAIRLQFVNQWGKQTPPEPRLQRIFKVTVLDDLLAEYQAYKDNVASREDPNVRRRFHGTGSECAVGIDIGSRPCSSPSCSVCGILTSGFLGEKAGSGAVGGQRRRLRYGKGIYVSATSGKSHDYA